MEDLHGAPGGRRILPKKDVEGGPEDLARGGLSAGMDFEGLGERGLLGELDFGDLEGSGSPTVGGF